jgi:uncharacterized repeat protein (TIGR01451 family)
VTHLTELAAQSAITTAINEGRLIVNYAGHGATQLWAGERLLSLASIPYLSNVGKLPFFVPMTCLEGYFIIPSPPNDNFAALAESLVRHPAGGAIASWSATGLGLATGHVYLDHGLFEAIFAKDIIELGPATTYAKGYLAAHTAWYNDLLDSYTLFGDPALRLAVLTDVEISKQIAASQSRFDDGDAITYTLTYSNTGATIAYGVAITDILPTEILTPSVLSAGAVITARVGTSFAWDVANLAPGTGGIITITGIVSVTSADQAFLNAATIATISSEKDLLDNGSTAMANPHRAYLPLILKVSPTP